MADNIRSLLEQAASLARKTQEALHPDRPLVRLIQWHDFDDGEMPEPVERPGVHIKDFSRGVPAARLRVCSGLPAAG